jgi:two-component system response regulator PilR (NtrC family)
MTEKNSILLVDDDIEFGKAMKRMFEKAGYAITLAGDGREALERLSEGTFDVIISDLRMPNVDGTELMEEISRLKLETPVVFLTAFGEVESYMDVMNLGAFEYLHKPVRKKDILNVVQKAIEQKGKLGPVAQT